MTVCPPRVRAYAQEEADRFGVSPDDILSPDRQSAKIAAARREVMRRLRNDRFTCEQIGRWMGRHYSTVLYATTPGYRERTLAEQRASRERQNARQRERYAIDAEYRERRKSWSRLQGAK